MRKILTTLMMLLAMGWLLSGCESDSTAPDDDLPPVTDEDVATQSSYLAQAMLEVAPVALEFEGNKADADDGLYTYTFGPSSDVQGTVLLYFEQGGEPSGFDVADHARAWTGDGAPLTLEPIEGGVVWELSFDLDSDIEQATDSVVVDGDGTLVIGAFEATWTVAGFAYTAGDDYPDAGTITFTNEGRTATVVFDGDETVTITVGEDSWSFNLETGALTEL